MAKQNIDHNSEYERVINHFDTRITNLANRHNANAKRQIETVWPIARLMAEIKAFTPSTKALGRVREERFPFITSGDLSRYIYIGQNMDAVKKWYDDTDCKLTSAQRIASSHKAYLKAEKDKQDAINQYKKDAGKTADIASNGMAEYMKRLKAGQKSAPTQTEQTHNAKCKTAVQALYSAVDSLLKLHKVEPLTDEIVQAISDEMVALNAILTDSKTIKAA